MEIMGCNYDIIEDPFGILEGERYEFFVDIDVPEDDELFSEKGLKVKLLLIKKDNHYQLSHYHIIEKTTEKVLDFELEEEEEKMLIEYCIKELEE